MTRKALTAGLVAMMSLVALEYMAVATAMPVVAEELGGVELYGLAFSGAMAASVVGTVLGGRWADLRGPRAPLWTGVAGFAAGLAVAGLAPSMEVLIAGRFVQGFGGALVSVALYVVVARVYPESLHPKVFSLFATAWVVPSMVGPAVVGVVTDTLGWRWVFLLVPVLTVAAGLVLLRGLAGQPVSGGQRAPAPGLAAKVAWAAVTAVGAGLMQYGSGGTGEGGGSWRWILLAAGLAVLAVALPRLLPAGTLRAARGLPSVVGLRGLAAGAFFAAEVMVPLMLREQRGLSTTAAGLVLTGGALSWSFASWLQGREVFGQRTNLRLGAGMIALGVLVMGAVTVPAVPVAVAYPAWIVTGFGIGLVYPTLSVLTLELSAPGEQGENSSALQVGESVFSVVSVAVTGALFAAAGSGYWAVFAATLAMALAGLAIAPRAFRAKASGTGPAGAAEPVAGEVSRSG
ncbi:MFS transporter [Actinomadura sp. ATCC 31491]|uniref:MFS transporter n=1 Tax=Actinomadura luzonensis TaxID=2805427 RepID=A0ABT0FLF9_9ACTN|nr:MFS transporter [Actinomadura luzonensis]MCK2212791.1 MFS transporter [Actinomadura luzonensis]